ncbi:hypothetical protein [Teredinibacter purpureus]|uniref:hypothetical protein n=1 Tax=Teredinibacter purpureus TaxID=2731756 RepID=UPI0013C41EA7|nr:hypothetical protein [Teredinibacter purpureus]
MGKKFGTSAAGNRTTIAATNNFIKDAATFCLFITATKQKTIHARKNTIDE